ncbi:TGF-beta receptor type-2 [Liparis tanakae]|uniref:receptor protein serine/threonine kinase n=1 Tax=Liparis tanakae TaxID=230148 RepID=A0A4Z2HX50_9TELE|nr:TGF-beta receptor type-2 [Liparis tanakae]
MSSSLESSGLESSGLDPSGLESSARESSGVLGLNPLAPAGSGIVNSYLAFCYLPVWGSQNRDRRGFFHSGSSHCRLRESASVPYLYCLLTLDSVCSSNCSLSSFCTVTEEICVAICYTTSWRGRPDAPPAIRLEALVGKGRFAEVWRASLPRGEKGGVDGDDAVAVKVFPAVEYASWRNECFIFSDATLEHDNVVRFLAAQERGVPGLRRYWLVLAYHGLGNLQDFLTANTLSWEELVSMAGSVARGLAHLHSDATASGVPKVRHDHTLRDYIKREVIVLTSIQPVEPPGGQERECSSNT